MLQPKIYPILTCYYWTVVSLHQATNLIFYVLEMLLVNKVFLGRLLCIDEHFIEFYIWKRYLTQVDHSQGLPSIGPSHSFMHKQTSIKLHIALAILLNMITLIFILIMSAYSEEIKRKLLQSYHYFSYANLFPGMAMTVGSMWLMFFTLLCSLLFFITQ